MKKKNSIVAGDTVIFISPNYVIYDRGGREVYKDLAPGGIYTVEDSCILTIKLKDKKGLYLKEHFRKYDR